MSREVVLQMNVGPATETESIRDEVMPRLALWLADVSAEAALTPVERLDESDDPAICEPPPR